MTGVLLGGYMINESLFQEPQAVVLLAPPSGGKGTQARLLESQHGYARIEMSELLRRRLTKEEKETIDAGGLIEDGRVCELFAEEMKLLRHHKKIVADGFSRTDVQALQGIHFFREEGRVPLFIALNVPDVICEQRLLNRIKEGSTRKDDNVEVLRRRLAIYRANLPEIRKVVVQNTEDAWIAVQGTSPVDVVNQSIMEHVDSRIRDYAASGAKTARCLTA